MPGPALTALRYRSKMRIGTFGVALLGAMAFVACSTKDELPPLPTGPTGQPTGSGSTSPSATATTPPNPDASVPPGPTDAATDAAKAPPPVPSGCIQNVTAGDRVYTCEGFAVDATIPEACLAPGCGLILQIHGDTGTGKLIDANTNLHALGKQKGYVVISPTGPPYGGGQPGSTWTRADDTKLLAITRLFAQVFRVDDKRIHATGFSRGGFVTWRLLCDASDLFASFAPAAAGNGNGEVTCFSSGRTPARKADVLFLVGRTDVPVPFATMTSLRDALVADYGLGASTPTTVASDANYTHRRWTKMGAGTLEVFEHGYETEPSGPFGSSRGHCFPGSKMPPNSPQYAVPCKGPNAFTWGEEVLKFFEAHPKR